MWRYKCPICGEKITEKKDSKDVKALTGLSHKCPNCNGYLFIDEGGEPVDLGKMLVRALELSTGVIISKELALANYHEWGGST